MYSQQFSNREKKINFFLVTGPLFSSSLKTVRKFEVFIEHIFLKWWRFIHITHTNKRLIQTSASGSYILQIRFSQIRWEANNIHQPATSVLSESFTVERAHTSIKLKRGPQEQRKKPTATTKITPTWDTHVSPTEISTLNPPPPSNPRVRPETQPKSSECQTRRRRPTWFGRDDGSRPRTHTQGRVFYRAKRPVPTNLIRSPNFIDCPLPPPSPAPLAAGNRRNSTRGQHDADSCVSAPAARAAAGRRCRPASRRKPME